MYGQFLFCAWDVISYSYFDFYVIIELIKYVDGNFGYEFINYNYYYWNNAYTYLHDGITSKIINKLCKIAKKKKNLIR